MKLLSTDTDTDTAMHLLAGEMWCSNHWVWYARECRFCTRVWQNRMRRREIRQLRVERGVARKQRGLKGV